LASIYVTNYGIVLYSGTEIPFMFLTVLSLFLAFQKKPYSLFCSGILLAIANWIRPFLPVYLIVIILIILLSRFKIVYKLKLISAHFIGILITILIIGLLSYKNSGFFIFQSTTGGVNLIMGANDKADGSYNTEVFKKGNLGYIVKEISFAQRDSLLKSYAVNWIKMNPIKYLLLAPKKIFYLYAHDFYAMNPLSGNMKNVVESKEYILKLFSSFPHFNTFQFLMLENQLFYILLFIFCLLGIYYSLNQKNSNLNLICLIWILGTCFTIITVGGARYHYPYMPYVLALASFAIYNIFFLNKYEKLDRQQKKTGFL
jgi:hypothetical protein